MTPAVAWCQHSCIFCWRPIEHTAGTEIKGEVDEPAFIVDNSIAEQKRIISGYWGHPLVDKDKLKEAEEPNNVAISLAGEPTTYTHITELVDVFKSRDMTTFLVTNGLNSDQIDLVRPTQLYLSLIAYDSDLYKRINRPQVRDGWERLNEGIEAFRDNPSKKVVRITLVRGYNLEHPERFAKLIERANPDFIEPKGYVHVGYSRRRLERSDMPSLHEVLEFSKRLSEATGYEVADYSESSKVALLKRR